MGEFVRLEVDAETKVGTIRIERPPMNALSRQVWLEIEATAREAAQHDDVRAVVVWGGPKVFAAGADIKEFPNWDYHEVKRTGTVLQRALDTLARLPMVVIAAINGYALGGGCELALACDFRFIAENSKLGQPEILLGIIPGAGGTQRLPRLVGPARAKDIIFSGRFLDCNEALGIGMVDVVVPQDQVYAKAVEIASRYARGPIVALRAAKIAVNRGLQTDVQNGLLIERELFVNLFATEDQKIGMRSFIEQGPGKAEFVGR